MTLKFALALHLPAPSSKAIEPSQWDVQLLRIANAWLNRRQAGMEDDLLIVGSGFASEDELIGYLRPYGLAGARLATLDADIGDMYLEEEIGVAVERWRGQVHEGSIPAVDLNGFIDDLAYPTDGFWWAGVEASSVEEDEHSAALASLIPDSFRQQAGTWTAILMDRLRHRSDGEESSDYEASITMLVLAYWLNGFDAASENGFFDFSATEGFEATAIDVSALLTTPLHSDARCSNECSLGVVRSATRENLGQRRISHSVDDRPICSLVRGRVRRTRPLSAVRR